MIGAIMLLIKLDRSGRGGGVVVILYYPLKLLLSHKYCV